MHNLLKTVVTLIVLLLLSPVSIFSEKVFEVIPNSVGLGLQKNYDIDSGYGGEERCIPYNLGNPASENATGWLVVTEELGRFHTHNEPETLFVPSGTFRYNSSCCLLEIDACFKLPYVFEQTRIHGKVTSAFTATKKPETQITGSATGSTVAYGLDIDVKPTTELWIKANEKKCFNYYTTMNVTSYGVSNGNNLYLPQESSMYRDNQIFYCFKAPFFVIFDKRQEIGLEVNDKNQGNVNIIIKRNNTLLISVVVVCLAIIGAIIFLIKRGKPKPSQPPVSSSDSSYPSFSPQPLELLHQQSLKIQTHP